MKKLFDDYEVFYGIEHLSKIQTSITLAFDVETTQLQPERGKLRLLQLGSFSLKTVVVIDLWELDAKEMLKLNYLFNTPRTWLAHNAVFDIAWLQENRLFPHGRIHCSFLASRLITNGLPNVKHGLAEVAKRYLKEPDGSPVILDKEEQRSDWSQSDLTDSQIEYAAKDVMALCELDLPLTQRIGAGNLANAFTLECRAIPAMAQMWRSGLYWNKEDLEQRREDYGFDAAEMKKEFIVKLDAALPADQRLPRDEDGSLNLRPKATGKVREGTKKEAGFNLNSPKQMLEKVTALLGEAPKDKDGKPSASRQALREYGGSHEAIQIFLDYRKAEKRRQMCDSVLEKLDGGYAKAGYMQLGAETGRMSCIKPNLQQIPRDQAFRACVQAPEGWSIIAGDFSQMELRLAAALAKDELMTSAFVEGVDIHTLTADRIGCSRQIAKSGNFGLLYGSGPKGLQNYCAASGVSLTIEEATDIRKQWLETYWGIANWQQQQGLDAHVEKSGKFSFVRIPESGLRRYLPGDMNRLTVRCNTPVQGAGAAVLKHALGSLWQQVKDAGENEVKISGCVHDEILLYSIEDRADYWKGVLKRTMEASEQIWLGDIPAAADVHVGRTWAEVH